ncbi:MAG: polyprenyl synthetase family protein [Bacteroidales bacterium]|jgi:geranylgeranyl diphosphate synthase type II|nr:polyprenyl synthetase family protein [Bacteroidales bacterium]
MYNQSQLKELVDKALMNLSYDTEAPRLIDPVKYIMSLGGKRLRPVMLLMACNIFSDRINDAVMPAAGIEIFHNFTLVHDDIMDQASLRRGLATIHQKWNVNQAILSGDVMVFLAGDCFLQIPEQNLVRVLRIFNRAARDVCAGQQLDMDYEKAVIVSQDEYLKMIELKTAVLIAASVKIGAIIGGADDKNADLLSEFGNNLGLAFQIQDDILDVWGDSKVFGKKPGGDIVANKKTLPLVKAMEKASVSQKKILQELFTEPEADPEVKVRKVIEVYDELDIRNTTESLAREYISKAFALLRKLPVEEKRKQEMVNLATSLIEREC